MTERDTERERHRKRETKTEKNIYRILLMSKAHMNALEFLIPYPPCGLSAKKVNHGGPGPLQAPKFLISLS